MFPRTLEMLDQYDLLTRLNQVGFVSRSGVNYDKNGHRDSTCGMRHVFDAMQDHTFLDYMLNIRLKYTEDIVKAEYEKIGGLVVSGWEVIGLTTQVDHGGHGDAPVYPVKVEAKNINTAETRTLAAWVAAAGPPFLLIIDDTGLFREYFVGADGGPDVGAYFARFLVQGPPSLDIRYSGRSRNTELDSDGGYSNR